MHVIHLEKDFVLDPTISSFAKVVAATLGFLYMDEEGEDIQEIPISTRDIELELFYPVATTHMQTLVKNALEELQKNEIIFEYARSIYCGPRRSKMINLGRGSVAIDYDTMKGLIQKRINDRMFTAETMMWAEAMLEGEDYAFIDSGGIRVFISKKHEGALRRLADQGLYYVAHGKGRIDGCRYSRNFTLVARSKMKLFEVLRSKMQEGVIDTTYFTDNKKEPINLTLAELNSALQIYRRFEREGKRCSYSYDLLRNTYEVLLEWNRKNRDEAEKKGKTTFRHRDLTLFRRFDFFNMKEAIDSIDVRIPEPEEND